MQLVNILCDCFWVDLVNICLQSLVYCYKQLWVPQLNCPTLSSVFSVTNAFSPTCKKRSVYERLHFSEYCQCCEVKVSWGCVYKYHYIVIFNCSKNYKKCVHILEAVFSQQEESFRTIRPLWKIFVNLR